MTSPKGNSRRRGLLRVVFLLYIGVLAAVVFWPSPVDAGSADTLQSLLDTLHRHGLPRTVDYAVVESAANVALFVPFGLLGAACLSERAAWLAAAAGAALSCAVEAGQYLLLPDRYATLNDVLANTLGAALGTLAVYAFRGRRRRPGS